jgi:hypothetical protein
MTLSSVMRALLLRGQLIHPLAPFPVTLPEGIEPGEQKTRRFKPA